MKCVTSAIQKAFADRKGSVYVAFAFTLPVLLTVSLSGLDFAWAVMQKQALQEAADAAAIAGGEELSLSDAKRENVAAVVQAMVERSLAVNANTLIKKTAIKPTVTATIHDDPLEVQVDIKQPVQAVVGDLFGLTFQPLRISSTARVIGKPNICALILDPSSNGALSLEHDSRMTGRDCAVYTNSTHTNAIKAKNSATLIAKFICSAGGKSGGPGNFDPVPLTDCPTFEDPLGSRPEPEVGSCTETDLELTSGYYSLSPGTYCGGIAIRAGAEVVLTEGVYVIKDGPLLVDDGAILTSRNGGLFFTGANAYFRIAGDTRINMEAPRSGSMAGLLMFESRAQPSTTQHQFLSDNESNLVGTIYLPRSELKIDADGDISPDAAYTAIVAHRLRLYGGPHLILNSNYDQTDVPVPKGIRGAGQPISLVN